MMEEVLKKHPLPFLLIALGMVGNLRLNQGGLSVKDEHIAGFFLFTIEIGVRNRGQNVRLKR